MFDVRPRQQTGELDLKKIERIEEILNLKITRDFKKFKRALDLKRAKEKIVGISEIKEKLIGQDTPFIKEDKFASSWSGIEKYSGVSFVDQSEIISVFDALEAAHQILREAELKISPAVEADVSPDLDFESGSESLSAEEQKIIPDESIIFEEKIDFPNEARERIPEALVFRERNFKFQEEPVINLNSEINEEEKHFGGVLSPRSFLSKRRSSLAAFLTAAFLIFSIFPIVGWLNRAVSAKSSILNYGLAGYEALVSAKDSLMKKDFSGAEAHFGRANILFASANSQLSEAGGLLVVLLEKAPGLSYVSSRVNLIKAGEELSKAGQNFTHLVNLLGENTMDFNSSGGEMIFPGALSEGRDYLEAAISHLIAGNDYLQKIKASALPPEVQGQLTSLQGKFPEALSLARQSLEWSDEFLKIFGSEKAKKYLLVFQNNSEMRPTGGFIGTYGILDLDNGQIKNIFIDGIFNPDGQLQEKIIPPSPIQKISTAWSMHDSNWFADFPSSAKKMMWFFEKTGGPTTDGVIALTPTIIERLLEQTGPIDLPQYGVLLDADNFVELTQYKVELDYDKEENQPKKILSDFAPKFIEKIGGRLKAGDLEVLKIINECLKEKHVLFYFSDPELEEFVQKQGWGGELLSVEQDFFSVVHANINGYKTDRVINEEIRHSSEIQADGSIIDRLEILRHHNGGNSSYEWYNKVNADYMRVYLPKGSQLISASGHTVEKNIPPIDYSTGGFKADPEIALQEANLIVDEKTGTHIFEENGKTVFGNWVFVSPGESVKVIYEYRLPFKLNLVEDTVAFSLVAQKQSGSIGSRLGISVEAPFSWGISWLGSQKTQKNLIEAESNLKEDQFFNAVLKRE
ncbi:MAG: DUF4012 domain-containing protein [Candidatus Portnoybacteria bacterium]|nr:DUF4012 domain-containing protein [Candidatus Portnoybacteria bacterium]